MVYPWEFASISWTYIEQKYFNSDNIQFCNIPCNMYPYLPPNTNNTNANTNTNTGTNTSTHSPSMALYLMPYYMRNSWLASKPHIYSGIEIRHRDNCGAWRMNDNRYCRALYNNDGRFVEFPRVGNMIIMQQLHLSLIQCDAAYQHLTSIQLHEEFLYDAIDVYESYMLNAHINRNIDVIEAYKHHKDLVKMVKYNDIIVL